MGPFLGSQLLLICIWSSGKEHLSITIMIVPTLILPELVWLGHCCLCVDYIFYEWFQCGSAVEKWPTIVFSAKWWNKLLSGTSYVLCMLNMVQIQESVMKKKKKTIVAITCQVQFNIWMLNFNTLNSLGTDYLRDHLCSLNLSSYLDQQVRSIWRFPCCQQSA